MSEPNARAHTISLIVENKSGVLARIAQLISSKGYNIESLAVGATHDETVSQMTLVVRGDEWVIEQACKQLNRLIDIIKVIDVTDEETVERELVLVRVRSDGEARAEICRIVDIFRANVVDATPTAFTLQLAGTHDKLEAFIDLLTPWGIQKLYRTGKVVMPRSPRAIRPAQSTPV